MMKFKSTPYIDAKFYQRIPLHLLHTELPEWVLHKAQLLPVKTYLEKKVKFRCLMAESAHPGHNLKKHDC